MDQERERLAQLFLKFPGIGRRQAARFAYFVLSQPQDYVQHLAQALTAARNQAHTCTRCFRVFEGSDGLCDICRNTVRDQHQLMVVEKSQDIDAFAKTDYHGLFFVLGNLIPIVQKDVLAGTHLPQLKARVEKDSKEFPDIEVILAFPLTPNGDHTDIIVREHLAGLPITISSLGRGLSTGAELEYADAQSLNASLKKRE
jgi:recombination protein RecR